MSDKLEVVVADDTVTFRMVLKHIIDGFNNCECVATAPNGKIALRKVKELKPGLVILDVEMPELDGPQTLKKIREFDPYVPVIMVSGFNMENAKKVVSALENGALDFITKPVSASAEESEKELTETLRPLINMVEVRQIVRNLKDTRLPAAAPSATRPVPSSSPSSSPSSPVPPSPVPPPAGDVPAKPPSKPKKRRHILPPSQVDLLLVAVSTGGPNALQQVIPALPADLSCPVLLVQHMPPMFTQSLAERLNNLSDLTVVEAADGDIPTPGTVYIAPGGRHMVVRKNFTGGQVSHELHMVDIPPVNSCRPAADVLFKSVSRLFKKNLLILVMTGMGCDGADGVELLKKNNAYCLIQDQDTSVVWGMPGEVYNRGAADEVLPVDQIAPRISRLVMKRF